MDRLQKLLRKISQRDRERLLGVLALLKQGALEGSDIIKLSGASYYRLRSGRFRIIFHREARTDKIIIDSAKMRDEHTYK